MEMKSTEERHTGDVATEQRDRTARLNFSNLGEREAHINAFLAWLPKILHEAPGIRWEHMPSPVMGYLIRSVADSPDTIPITLATGCAMDALKKSKVLYCHCCSLNKLLKQLRSHYGVTTLSELRRRAIWEDFVKDRMISPGELRNLTIYDTLASVHLPFYLEGLTERQQVIWKPYLLPPLPRGFLDKQAQQKAVVKASQDRRREQSDVVLPLFPLLVELAQLRKQAAERLVKEYLRQKDRAARGEIELPYQFEYVDRQFSVSSQATTLAEVRLIEREVTLSFTLWNRTSWVKAHLKQCGHNIRAEGKRQVEAYAPERNGYFLQYEGASSNLLWCGDLIEQRLLGGRSGKSGRGGLIVTRPALLTPARGDAEWFRWARDSSGAVLFEPESLYRGTLFATALATLALTNGSRAAELLQVSASRFETIVVDELKNQQPTGRQIGLCVQKLLPKGYTHESERQFFLISDMALRLLKEMAELLQAAHGGTIPIVHPNIHNHKAEDLLPEPYFFQWAASEDRRIGLLSTKDVAHLLRFLFHGLTLTTRTGEPIRIAPHLLRHVLATHARTVQNVPAEAVAYLLHHRVMLPGSTQALTISEATAYYSRLPIGKLLALLSDVQSTLVSPQGRSYLHVPDLSTIEQKEAALRRIFEQWGMIGPTVLGFCSAGICVRPGNRGICANCQYLVPHYSNLPKAKIWRRFYVLQAKMHDDQGHAVDAQEARKVVQYLDDMMRMMEIQIRTRQDGGYLPFADTLPPAQDEEGEDQ
jgi:hypothetical protein